MPTALMERRKAGLHVEMNESGYESRYSPGGVVSFGSHRWKVLVQYSWAWGIWKTSS